MKIITAVILNCEQIGPDNYKMKNYSRNFSSDCPTEYIIKWAENMGVKNATINSVILCEYTGSSA